MADMEMEEADQSPDQPILGFGVLQFIKTAQSQHGLRHNDFKRYRYGMVDVFSEFYNSFSFQDLLYGPLASVLAGSTASWLLLQAILHQKAASLQA